MSWHNRYDEHIITERKDKSEAVQTLLCIWLSPKLWPTFEEQIKFSARNLPFGIRWLWLSYSALLFIHIGASFASLFCSVFFVQNVVRTEPRHYLRSLCHCLQFLVTPTVAYSPKSPLCVLCVTYKLRLSVGYRAMPSVHRC